MEKYLIIAPNTNTPITGKVLIDETIGTSNRRSAFNLQWDVTNSKEEMKDVVKQRENQLRDVYVFKLIGDAEYFMSSEIVTKLPDRVDFDAPPSTPVRDYKLYP